jgi:hypothetical protein
MAHYTKLSTVVSTMDPVAGGKLAEVLTDVLGWCSDEEHADALRRLAIAMTEIAIEFRDRANDLDRITIDGESVAHPNRLGIAGLPAVVDAVHGEAVQPDLEPVRVVQVDDPADGRLDHR